MTDKPKLWSEMTDAEKGALLLAAHQGKAIQFHDRDGTWLTGRPSWPSWQDDFAYRVKPKAPKVETVKCHYSHTAQIQPGFYSGHCKRPGCTNLTLTTSDGHITSIEIHQ